MKFITCTAILCCLFWGARALAHPGSGVVVDKQGNIYFTDTGQGVWKIDTRGTLTYVPASRWHWMAIDEEGRFAESQKNFGEWFERVTPQSSKPALIMCSDFPLTVGRDGNLYYADTRAGSPRIVRRSPDGTESVLARGEIFRGVAGIVAANDGSLYVTDAGPDNVSEIRRITKEGTISVFASGFVDSAGAKNASLDASPGYCRGMAFDSVGALYVAATGSRRVLRINAQGNVSVILQAESPWSPTGVALYRGEIYVLEWHEPAASLGEVRRAWIPRVRKIARDGTVTTLATVSR